jgi:hypothetical protein
VKRVIDWFKSLLTEKDSLAEANNRFISSQQLYIDYIHLLRFLHKLKIKNDYMGITYYDALLRIRCIQDIVNRRL